MKKHTYCTHVKKIFTGLLAFVITAFVCAIAWYFIIQKILWNIESIPLYKRAGYDQPFEYLIPPIAFFLAISWILSAIIFYLFPGVSKNMFLKVVVGMLTCLLAMVILQLMTFGLGLTSPGMQAEYFVVAFAGGLRPAVQQVFVRAFDN